MFVYWTDIPIMLVNKEVIMRQVNEIVEPITPQAAKNKQSTVIPEIVIEVVNKLLIQNYNNSRITISQADIITAVCALMNIESNAFNLKWLNFENYYGQYGWKVIYDGPAYNETYAPVFYFTPLESLTMRSV